LQSLARGAELIPPWLALQVQTVKPGIRHARLALLGGGGPTGNGVTANPTNSIRQRQCSVNTFATENLKTF